MAALAWLTILLLLLALPVLALVIALRAAKRVGELRRRVAALERDGVTAAPPPARGTARAEPAPQPRAEPASEPSAGAAPGAPPPAPEPPPAAPPAPPPADTAPTAAAAPPPPPTGPRLPSVRTLEEQLGARLPIWLGAIALVLAAAFLVKLSFDRGWLGPPVRVALGVGFGVALLAVGERLRAGAALVAQGLSAAGIAVLFVSFYAAVGLYSLIPAAAGFALMALTTAVAVALSLRQGPIVAVLGLVGGFLTPYLVSTGEPEPRVLFLYLLLLQVGLLAVSRRRGWWPLAALSFAGGLAWLFLWLVDLYDRPHGLWLGLFVLVSSTVFAATGLRQVAGEGGRLGDGELAWLAGVGGMAGLAALTLRAGADPVAWGFLALLGAGALVLARREPRFHGLAWMAAAVPALLLANWAGDLESAEGGRFLWTALGLGLLHAGGAYLAHRGSAEADRWAWLSAASAVVYLLLAYWGGSEAAIDLPWGGICIALALLYLTLALPLARRRAGAPEMDAPLAALAVAVTAFVSLAVPIELEREWLAVAWALEVVALLWLAGRLAIPILARLAWIAAALVAVRLLLNPLVLTYPIGEHPLLNWLLYGYGIPLAAFLVAARLAQTRGREALAEALEWGAMGLATALATLLVRQYFHPGEPGAARFFLVEWGTITVVWLALAWGLLRLAQHWPRRSVAWFPQGLALLALAQAVLCQVLVRNPIWSHSPVGEWPVLNGLLWVYGAPAALLLLIARELPARRAPGLPIVSRVAALGLTFLLVTLEVRQAFRGSFLDEGSASSGEQYAYSAAWIVLGLVLLGAGIAGRGRLLRFASLAVMLLAVGKVFLFDLAELRDLYRVFSFLGLGISLLLIAWLYQRFVFAEGPGDGDEDGGAPAA